MHRQALALLLVCRAVTAGARRRMAECGTGHLSLGALCLSVPGKLCCPAVVCREGGGYGEGSRERVLCSLCAHRVWMHQQESANLGESTLLCHLWNLITSDCLLRRATDWAWVGETLKCWEVVDVPLHSGLCRYIMLLVGFSPPDFIP